MKKKDGKMLNIASISKHFNGIQAVRDVTFNIQQATIASLIGPNGAGKTTLFNIICGYIEPDKGEVKFKGINLNGRAPHQRAMVGLGRTFQNMRLIKKLSVLENLMLAFINHKGDSFIKNMTHSISRKHENRNREKAYELLDFVGIKDRGHEPAGSLSYGQQKLLSLACCLALDAKLLLLDEPVAGVNQETISRILLLLRRLKDSGGTSFLIEHNLDAVMEISDRLIVMDEGRIIADGIPSEVKEKPEVIEAYIS